MNETGISKVLVIDDDDAMTEMISLILEPEFFEVRETLSGEEGITVAHTWNPDVVILDLMMPGMDGWEVCRELRTFSQVPILVLSAVSKPGMIVRALDAGADDYLLKPMTSSVLIAHVKKLVRRARAEKDNNNYNFCST